jgi:hypothetical protein
MAFTFLMEIGKEARKRVARREPYCEPSRDSGHVTCIGKETAGFFPLRASPGSAGVPPASPMDWCDFWPAAGSLSVRTDDSYSFCLAGEEYVNALQSMIDWVVRVPAFLPLMSATPCELQYYRNVRQIP